MDRGRPVLIAAQSGRALAASARRGGYVPLVADNFGDQDTLAAAAGFVRIDFGRPVDGDKAIAALDTLAAGRDCAGIVCGSGFEDRADLLARIAARWTLLGNSADTVALIKNPVRFAAVCGAADVPCPEISLAAPPDPENWLAKRIGGAGGWHIRRADDRAKPGRDIYFQRRVCGAPVSALLLGDGRRVLVLGFSAQWSSPTARYPFRYGGAVRPAALDDETTDALTVAVERLNAVTPFVGIGSADFMIDGHSFHLLEINPRPGATFDLFEPEGTSLFALHLDACAGILPARPPAFEGAMAGSIVYADRDIDAVPTLAWPDWTADRPVAGSSVKADQPVCSVFARAATADAARRLAEQRSAAVHARIGAHAS
jgi:predicted ATP-grasp superfamily ATP-dependent carboligase